MKNTVRIYIAGVLFVILADLLITLLMTGGIDRSFTVQIGRLIGDFVVQIGS